MERFWPMLMLCFMGSGFIMPSLPSWALLFYALVVPCCVVRFFLKPIMLPKEALGAGLFMLWALVSMVWSPLWHGWLDVLCTALFVIGGAIALGDRPDIQIDIKRVCIVGMSINAALELSMLITGLDGRDRPGGIGVLHTTLPAVIIAGIGFLWASLFFLRQRKVRIETVGALLILPSFMVFSGSRVPCLVCALLTLALMFRVPYARLWRFGVLVGGGLVVSCSVMWLRLFRLFQGAVERGDSYHRLIWETVWDASRHAPLIGHGQGAPVQVHAGGQIFAHAHNLYLGVLYSYGFVGECLLFFAFLWPMVTRLRHREWDECVVPIFVAIVVLTDIATPLKGPSDIWYVLWVPWLCLISCRHTFLIRTDIGQR